MTLSLVTNTASLAAQRAMMNSNSALETSFERLSTGKRINSATDDAGGLSVGIGLESHVSGLNQAVRNVNDGISMVQIAEGAMDEVTTILQRMRDLAVQASNGSLSSTEQGYLDAEHAKLAETLGSVIDQSQFNGTDLVSDSAATTIVIQSGADSSDTTSLNFSKMTELSLGVDKDAINLAGNTSKIKSVTFENYLGTAQTKGAIETAALTLATGGVGAYTAKVDGVSFTTGSIAAPADVAALAAALNAVDGVSDLGAFADNGSGKLGFNASAGGEISVAAGVSGLSSQGFDSNLALTNFAANGSAGVDATSAGSNNTYTLTVGGQVFTTAAVAAGSGNTNKAVAGLMQAHLLTQGVTEFSIGTAGNHDNGVITLTYASATGAVDAGDYKFVKNNGSGGAAAANDVDGSTSGKSSTEVSITVASANDAITSIDAALAAVASERATLGATQAQLESTVRNLANVAENTAAAAGRIMDTDYAAETANLTKAQILQQAATSILAQANAQPQGVLSLLQ